MSATPHGWAGRPVLVTGGLGFLGSALTTTLAKQGAKVKVLDSLLPQFGGSPRHLNGYTDRVQVVVEDTRNRDAVNSAVEGVEVIFHLAAPSGPGSSAGDYLTDLDVACLGTWHLLEAVRVYAPKARVVFASSSHVYGSEASVPVREDAPTNPETLFGAHQLVAEKYLGAYRRAYALDTVIARLSVIFGPRQRIQGGAYGTVARALDSALRGEDVPLYRGGAQAQDYMFVNDAVDALLAIGAGTVPPDGIVNVGSGRGRTVRAMVEAVIAAVGRGSIRELPATTDVHTPGLHDFVADVSRLRSLGIGKGRDFGDALRETVDWYRSRRIDL